MFDSSAKIRKIKSMANIKHLNSTPAAVEHFNGTFQWSIFGGYCQISSNMTQTSWPCPNMVFAGVSSMLREHEQQTGH